MNQFNINYRIFKKERVKNNDRSLLIIPKNQEKGTFNQLELSWKNEFLEETYVSIVGRVTVKEWERVLEAYPINRAFIQIKEDNTTKFFITFKVIEDLSSTEIRNLIFTAINILNECLEKVTKKIVGEQVLGSYLNEIEETETLPSLSTNYEERLKEQDDLIKQMTLEVEQQENFLQSLDNMEKSIDAKMLSTEKTLLTDINNLQKKISAYEQQVEAFRVKEQRLMEENNQLREVSSHHTLTYEMKLKEVTTLINQKEGQIDKLNNEIKDYARKIQALTTKDNINAEMNVQLDKANLKLNEMLKQNKLDTNRLAQMSQVETKLKEIFKEKMALKTELSDTQRVVQQYENTNKRLNESLEKLQANQENLIGKAREDHGYLEDNLKESEKQIKLEKNEHQKVMIELKEVNQKLAQERLNREEKDKKIIQYDKKIKNYELTKQENQEKYKELEEELLQKNIQVKNIQVTNDLLKEKIENLEIKQAKFANIEDWEDKYETLEMKFTELNNEAYSYRQEIHLLNTQITKLEERVVTDIGKTGRDDRTVKEAPKKDTQKVQAVIEEEDYDYEYDYDYDYEYFTYEADPYVEDVVTEELINIRKKDQVKDEVKIQEYLSSFDTDDYTDVRIKSSEYKKYIMAFKFLTFRWDQVFIMDDIDKNTAFLEWCAPFIEDVDDFQEDLEYEVKKSIFNKKYVTMDKSTLNLLKGYSELSTYLDTYYLRVSYYIDKYFFNEGKQ